MNTKPPVTTVRSRWSAREEAQLQELIERRRRIMEENREPVLVIVGTFRPDPDRIDGANTLQEFHSQVADWLIANADALRDALEPFDSGVRAGSAT